MTRRPYVVLSCAMSLDGCLDGTGEDRLVLSGAADLDRVDAERAASDAILVGAGTIRRDNPRLLVRSAHRQAGRTARGLPPQPAGVTVTASGDLDPAARFFRGAGEGSDPEVPLRRIVYAARPAVPKLRDQLGGLAEVADAGDRPQLADLVSDLGRRGVGRLMVEGGASLGSQFLAAGLVDELQLAIAPFFVGDPAAPRFAGPGHYPAGPAHPLHLAEARPVGEIVLLRYLAPGPAAPAGRPAPREEAAASG
jgi:5-amino-6-(5-phosphoribosylamino)uracil reductase